jgi:3-oxoacyl-[acyl-carrier-protein] synthase-3
VPEANSDEIKMYKMYMNGREVFKFGARVIGESITEALAMTGMTVADLDLIVPHQANMRIIQAAARTLNIETDMFMSNLDRYGNTSAASIPIALCEAIDAGRVNVGDNIALCGFGGGLAWASMVLTWTGVETGEPRTLGKQRRQLSYLGARWRRQLIRMGRQVDGVVNRIHPERGRLSRLRHKFDKQKLD